MSSKNTWYDILDLEKFIESTRVLVFDSFGKTLKENNEELNIKISELKTEEIEELNKILTQQECLVISKDFIKQIRGSYRINEKKYMAMIESFNSRMISNMLRNLTSSGVLESAYDSEVNDFVFWIKDDDKKEIQKPETD